MKSKTKKKSPKKQKELTPLHRLKKRQWQLIRMSCVLEGVGYLLRTQDTNSELPEAVSGLGHQLEHMGKQLMLVVRDIDEACPLIDN